MASLAASVWARSVPASSNSCGAGGGKMRSQSEVGVGQLGSGQGTDLTCRVVRCHQPEFGQAGAPTTCCWHTLPSLPAPVAEHARPPGTPPRWAPPSRAGPAAAPRPPPQTRWSGCPAARPARRSSPPPPPVREGAVGLALVSQRTAGQQSAQPLGCNPGSTLAISLFPIPPAHPTPPRPTFCLGLMADSSVAMFLRASALSEGGAMTTMPSLRVSISTTSCGGGRAGRWAAVSEAALGWGQQASRCSHLHKFPCPLDIGTCVQPPAQLCNHPPSSARPAGPPTTGQTSPSAPPPW